MTDFDAALATTLSHREMIVALEAAGYMVTADAPGTERNIDLGGAPVGTVRFGVVSDTHLGHKHQQLTHLRAFCKEAEAWRVDFMLHAGDVVDGGRMHRDQEYELFRHGAIAQGKYAAEELPRVKVGRRVVPWKVIGGNHDGSFFNDAGADVLEYLNQRPDVAVLGAPAAMFHYGPLRIYLMHPDGGPSYARSYKLQKIVEGFEADAKPHILLAGHWHVQCHVSTRNVEAFALPCFQSQTAYLKRKGLQPVVGGYLFEVIYNELGPLSITSRFVRYSNPIPADYP